MNCSKCGSKMEERGKILKCSRCGYSRLIIGWRKGHIPVTKEVGYERFQDQDVPGVL